MTVLRTSKNGGVTMVIKPDGTKIRWGQNPELPESIDLKITDYCDAGCKFCHESSTPKGIHGNSGWIYNIVGQCIRGSELAIGGGNPLDHPDLEKILIAAKSQGIYANLTVNDKHLDYYKLPYLLRRDLICGIGVSVREFGDIPDDLIRLYARYHDRLVIHLIVGVHTYHNIDFIKSVLHSPKFLLLGYKEFGFGVKQKRIIERLWSEIEWWQNYLRSRPRVHISFDNLAIEQLDIPSIFPKEMEENYMGADGSHTMYIDAVAQQYAVKSTGERFDCLGKNLLTMFNHVKGMSNVV